MIIHSRWHDVIYFLIGCAVGAIGMQLLLIYRTATLRVAIKRSAVTAPSTFKAFHKPAGAGDDVFMQVQERTENP